MDTVVLYPSPGMGHLVSMVEFGNLILRRRPSSAITIIIAPPSFNTGSTAAYIRHISSTIPSISFLQLPQISLDLQSFPSMESAIFELIRRSNHNVRSALHSISRSAAVSAFVIDFFCAFSLPIARELQIPTYFYLTSGACILAFFLNFPQIHRTTTLSFRDMNSFLEVPGIPPIIPSADMIKPILDRDSSDYEDFLYFSSSLPDADGVIVNTFESLEIKPLEAIRAGKWCSGGRTPPIYCVGPILNSDDRDGGDHDCLRWLDKQPTKSVVFLCFGSLGLHSAVQLQEIAIGLEKSGERFLWVVRSPPTEDPSKKFLPPAPPDLDNLLPQGFLDRTKDRGFVVKTWAPQVAVLNHGAVGGFVTHCGWNSVLEAVFAGVPMVAWPMYAEQKMNREVLVEDMKMALRLDDGGLVAAADLEGQVKELMNAESEVRKVVEEKSREAKAAISDGGSSIVALEKLLEVWTCGSKK